MRLALLLLAACSDGPVTGRFVTDYITSAGEVSGTLDISDQDYRAYVHTDHGWVASRDVLGKSDGTFEIDGLPDGAVVLHSTAHFLNSAFAYWSDHDDREIVTWSVLEGRPDAVRDVSLADPEITLSVTGMTPWQNTDGLLFDCWGTGDEIEPSFFTGIDTGGVTLETTFRWAPYSWAEPGPAGYLIQPSHGDTLALYHSIRIASSPTISRLAQAAALQSSDQAPDTLLVATGAFTDVPLTSSQLALSIDLDAFAAAFAIPSDARVGWDFNVVAGSAVDRDLDQGPDLLEVSDTTRSGVVTVTQPLPALVDPAWQTAIIASYAVFSATDALIGGARTYARLASDSFAFTPPPLPGAITINGAPVADLALTDDGFEIEVEGAKQFDAEVDVQAPLQGKFTWRAISRISASRDRISLPPEVFADGGFYSLVVYVGDAYTRTNSFTVHR